MIQENKELIILIFSSSVFQLVMDIVTPKPLHMWLNVEPTYHSVIRDIEVMKLDNLKEKKEMNDTIKP